MNFSKSIVVTACAGAIWAGLLCSTATAQRVAGGNEGGDPRGPPEFSVCSQNLMQFGRFPDVQMRTPKVSADALKERTRLLARRIAQAKCDVVAVQELLGRTEVDAEQGLQLLAGDLRVLTARIFDPYVGRTNDDWIRNGFLVARDRAQVENQVSYARVELPKLVTDQKPRFFPRGPFELQLRVNGRDGSDQKTVSLVTFHFKSHAGKGDPTGLEWETYRMEMAEGLRQLILRRHAQSFDSAETLLVVLGDRNDNFDAASAKILDGTLRLQNFQDEGLCRLSKRGNPLCQAKAAKPASLFSVLLQNPTTKDLPGTFTFGKKTFWLDDILLPSETLPFAWSDFEHEGFYASGVVNEPKDASDHALVFVRLNW